MHVRADSILLKRKRSDATKKPISYGDEWIVIFTPKMAEGRNRWWHWFRKPGFVHVCAITYDPLHEVWLLADWNLYNLCIKILTPEEADILFTMMWYGATFMRYTSEQPAGASTRSICLYCVSMIKHLLGVKSLAITPYQLFCALKKRGGRVIVPKELQEE